jgi:GTPase SAR1 family protein
MTETAGADSNTMHMKYKIVFLGDQSVGKTSLILRFTQDSFDSSYQVKFGRSIKALYLGNHWHRFPVKDHVC